MKLLVMCYFSSSHSVLKRFVLQTSKNQGLFWKGLKQEPNLFRLTDCNMMYASDSEMDMPRLDGSVVSVLDSRPGGCEFDPQFRQTFFTAYFCLSSLQKHVRKVVCGFGKKVVLVLV